MSVALALVALLVPQDPEPRKLAGPFLHFAGDVIQVLPHGALGRRVADPEPAREREQLQARARREPVNVWHARARVAREVRFAPAPAGNGEAAAVTTTMADAAVTHAEQTLTRFAETVRLYSGGRIGFELDFAALSQPLLHTLEDQEPLFLVPTRDQDFGIDGRHMDSVFLFWSPGRLATSMWGGTLAAPLGPNGAAATGLAHVPMRETSPDAWSEVLLHEWLHQVEVLAREKAGMPWLPSSHDARDLGYASDAAMHRDLLRFFLTPRVLETLRVRVAAELPPVERLPPGPPREYAAIAEDSWRRLPVLDDHALAARTGIAGLRVVAGAGWVLAQHAGAPRAAAEAEGETVLDNQLSLDRESALVIPFTNAAGSPRQLVLVRADLGDLYGAWLGPLAADVARGVVGVALPMREPRVRGLWRWGGSATPLYVFETGFPTLPRTELELLAIQDGASALAFALERPPVAGAPLALRVTTRGLEPPALAVRLGERQLTLRREPDGVSVELDLDRAGPLSLTFAAGALGELPFCCDVLPRVALRLAPESGPLAVVRPRAPFTLLATNHGAELECALEVWTPPDLRIDGLPSVLRLRAGASASFPCTIDVEPERPTGDVEVRCIARARGETPEDWSAGRPLGRTDVTLRCAPGRDFLRLDGEVPARRGVGAARRATLRTDGEWVVELASGDAAVGAGHLACKDGGGSRHGRVHLFGPDAPSFDTEQFPVLAFWFRSDGAGRAALNARVGEQTVSIPLVGGFTRWGDARIELPLAEVATDGAWHRVVYDLDAALDAVLGTGPHRVTAIDLGDPRASWSNRFVAQDVATFDLDDFAVQRRGELTDGDRLRALTQRFVAGATGPALDRLERELAAIERAGLDSSDRVDHLLLGHRIALRRLEPTLPKKEPQQPCGIERYAALLRHEHLLTETPDQLLAIGQEQVRVHQAMLQELAGKIAPGKEWREVVALLQERHPSAAELPEFARTAMCRARDFAIAQGLVTIPMAARHGVIDVVTDGQLSRTYPFGGYGGARPSPFGFTGTYFVSPPAKWMNEAEAALRLRGNHEAWTRVVALHELIPGHHLQNVVHQLRPLSAFRRACFTNVFVEGWALYCEDLMHRHGFFPDDATRFTQLQMRLWRAARVVIDVSFQCGRMSRAECERMLVEEVALDPVNAKAEVLRYVDAPTQPMSYLVGWLQIRELVEEAQQRAGAGFRLPQFLDRLLSFGAIPPAAIRAGLWP